MRNFFICSKFVEKGINLPVRKTKFSAGYDIESAEDTLIPAHQTRLVPTGLKATMEEDEYLQLVIRSGIAVNNMLTLINANGIIDADYFNNPENEGHIQLAVVNHSNSDYHIAKGQRVAQGIFSPFLLTDDDALVEKEVRVGGKGSTGV